MSKANKLPSLAIAGICGRMGRAIAEVGFERGYEILGGTEAPNSEFINQSVKFGSKSVTTVIDPKVAADSATVWVDFTRPEATVNALENLSDTNVNGIVIGTTGFSQNEEEKIGFAAERFAIIKAGNFSLGITLLCSLVRLASQKLSSDWDIEILETHHRHKLDAPSGTALMLGQAVADGKQRNLSEIQREPYDGRQAKRRVGELGFAVRRAGGVAGEHEVMLANEYELIRLSHSALDRKVFAQGALFAANWIADQKPGLYRIEDVLDL